MVIEAVAISAAGADGERAGRLCRGDGDNQEHEARYRERQIAQKLEHKAPPQRSEEATWEGFRDGESLPVALTRPASVGLAELHPVWTLYVRYRTVTFTAGVTDVEFR